MITKYTMKKAAQLANAKPNKLLDALEKHNIFIRDGFGTRIPNAHFQREGYFVADLTNVNFGTHNAIRHKVKVTPKGVAFLKEFIDGLDNKREILRSD